MRKFLKLFVSSFILLFALAFFSSTDVYASGEISILDESNVEIVGNYSYGNISYDEEHLKTFTIRNNTDKDITFLYSTTSWDISKVIFRFTNNNNILPANGTITVNITLLAEKDNLVGDLDTTVVFGYRDTDNVSNTHNLNIESTVIPKVVPKPEVRTDINYIYAGVNYGVPLDNNKYKSLYMQISGENNMTDAGTHTVTVSFRDKYKDSFRWDTGGNDPVTLNWEIAKVTETLVGTSYSNMSNNILSSISLPTGWSWDNPNTPITSGTNTYPASYTPTDLVNYNVVSGELVAVTGINEYTVSLPTDSNTTSNFSSDFQMLDTETKDITLNANTGFVFTSIKINGIEQITNEVASHTINLSNISSNITIETITEKIINNPNTSDNIFIYFISLLVVSTLLISISLYKKQINN